MARRPDPAKRRHWQRLLDRQRQSGRLTVRDFVCVYRLEETGVAGPAGMRGPPGHGQSRPRCLYC
jgi:hypothetical protein